MTFEMILLLEWVVIPILLWLIYFLPEDCFDIVKGKAFPLIVIYMFGLLIMSIMSIAFQDTGVMMSPIVVTALAVIILLVVTALAVIILYSFKNKDEGNMLISRALFTLFLDNKIVQ